MNIWILLVWIVIVKVNVVLFMVQWRHFNATYKGPEGDYTGTGVDQLAEVIRQIKETPTSRRMIMSAWNPCQLRHVSSTLSSPMYQFYVDDGHLLFYVPTFGRYVSSIPFNIASTSFLTIMIAHVTGLKPGGIFHTIGDAHIRRSYRTSIHTTSKKTVSISKMLYTWNVKNIEDFSIENFDIVDYQSHPRIKQQ